jgi:hypothetical protein
VNEVIDPSHEVANVMVSHMDSIFMQSHILADEREDFGGVNFVSG